MAGPYKSLDDLDAAMSAKEQAKPYQSIGDLDAAISQSDANDQQRLGFSAKQSLTSNPEQYIKARDLGSQFGIPPDVAERNLPEVEYRNKLDALIGTMQKSPALGGLMQDPGYLKRTHDDIEALAQIEFETKGFKEASMSLRKRQDDLRNQEFAAMIGRMPTAPVPQDVAGTSVMDETHSQNLTDSLRKGALNVAVQGEVLATLIDRALASAGSLVLPKPEAGGDVTVDSTTQQTQAALVQAAEAFAAAPSDKRMEVAGRIFEEAYNQGQSFKGLGDAIGYLAQNPAAVLNFMGEMGVAAVPGLAVGGGVTAPFRERILSSAMSQAMKSVANKAVTGAGVGFFANMLPTIGGEISEGLTKFDGDIRKALDRATTKGLAEGSVNALFGAIPLPFSGMGPAARMGNVLAETAYQATGGAAGAAAASASVGEEISVAELFLEAIGEGFGAPADLAVSARQGYAYRAATEMFKKGLDSERSLQAEAKLTQMVDVAAQTASIARDPSAVQDLVDAADEDGQTELYINARQFANVFNQSPVETAAALGVTPEALNDALASNTDIVVPLSTFTTAVARDQALRPIIEHTRVDPGDMSPSEARLWQSQQGDQFKAEAEAVLAKRQADEAYKAETEQVYQSILTDLNRVGRWPENVNKQYAALHLHFFETMAKRANMTVSQLWAMRTPRVVAQGQGALEQGGAPQTGAPFTADAFHGSRVAGLTVLDGNAPSVGREKAADSDGVVWTTANEDYAAEYSAGATLDNPAPIKQLGAKRGSVYRVRVSMRNPLVIDDVIGMTEADRRAAIDQAKAEGRDGVILRHVTKTNNDGVPTEWDDSLNEYAVFSNVAVPPAPTLQQGDIPADPENPATWPITMGQVEQMLERVYGQYREQLRNDGIYSWRGMLEHPEWADQVGMMAENEYTISDRYLKNLPEDVTADDLINAYKDKKLRTYIEVKKLPAMQVSPTGAEPAAAPYSQKQSGITEAEAKTLWETAIQRPTKKNQEAVLDARYRLFIEHNAGGVIEKLGIDKKEFNAKLKSWSAWKAKATETHERFNANREPAQQWWGIPNVAYISKQAVSAADVDQFVHSVEAPDKSWNTPDGERLRSYILRAFMGIDTGINYKDLSFVVDSTLKPLGQFNGQQRKITIRANSPHTVAHEIGHYLDNKWAREVGSDGQFASELGYVDGIITQRTSPEREQWHKRFKEFVKDIGGRADLRSDYTQRDVEVFARFVDQFVRWAEAQAGVRSWGESHYSDKFNEQDFRRFVTLLQEKAYVDINDGNPLNPVNDLAPSAQGATIASGTLAQGEGTPRASFDPSTNTIALLEGADWSSFLHESGHFFLEVMADLASRPDAPASIRKDFETALAWMGVQGSPETDPINTWSMMSLDEKRPYHEKWARGYEAYLFEGVAPSVEMQGIFQRFSQWLKQVYTSLKALNVELTDDVRGVFDRMLASEDAIKTAEAVRNFAPIFQTAEQAGMTAEEWEQYQAEGRESTDTAVDELQARSIRDMRWQANAKARKIKELQATAKELRAEVKIDVRREVLSQPLYRAWQFLTGKEVSQSALEYREAVNNYARQLAGWEKSREQKVKDVTTRAKQDVWEASEEGQVRYRKAESRVKAQAKVERRDAVQIQKRADEYMGQWESENPRPVEPTQSGKKTPEPKSDPNKVDPTKDTLLIAIAKLGGLDKLQAVEEWGLDPKEKIPQVAFGKPVVRKEGGRKLDAMAEALAQYGYLETDATGKWDNRQFEEMFFDALRGGEYFSQYGEEAMIAAATRDAQGDPDAGITLENTPAGKLNTEMLKGMYGETDTAPWRLLSALRMTSANGLAPDQVADLFGFTSGDDLVRRLAVAEDPKALIDQLTDQRMLELHGDLATPAEIELAAERAIHNDVRARVLTRELNALRKATGQGNVMLKAARMHADQWLARQTVKNATRHAQHVAAEGRSARAVTESMKAGDLAAAAQHKLDQVLNNQLARGSIRAAEEVRKAVKYLKKFDKAGSRKAIDQDYLDQIDQLLERFDMRQVSGKALEKRASLAAWLKQQEELGLDPVIDAALVEEAQRQHYSTLTLEEFRGLVDSIQSIEHMGRLKNRLLTAKDKREFKAVKDELVANIIANANRSVTTTNPITPLEKGAKILRNFSAMHRKFASIIREMDGGQDGGKMWEYLVRTMNDAGDAEVEMRSAMSEKFADLFAGLKGIKLNEKVYIPALKISLRREELLAVALNSGNEGNVQRLLDGGINESLRAITYRQLFDVLNMVTPQEWDFVEGVWGMIEANRPAIAAQEKALTGVEPKWVEPTPFTLASGRVIRGGYYPAKYNADMSTRSNELEAVTDLRQQMMGAGGRAATRKSYTEARAAEVSGRPMRLDLGVIAQHINEVTHRLAWQEWLIDARRILHAPDIDRAIRDHYGPEILAQLKKQLVDIAAGDNGPTDAMDRVMAHLRNGTTIAGMGWNIMTSLMQPIGLTQSAERIGVTWLGKGLAEYMRGNPFKVTAEVHERSSFMANRAKTLNREINDVLNQIKSERMSQVEASYFYLIQKFQQMVDIPTWLGAYEKAIAEGNTDDRAIALADQAVIDSQGAGQLKDLAAIQRGSAGQKLFTAFYSFFSTTYNRAVENYRATDFKNPMQVGKLAANYLLLFTLPAVWGWALKEALRGDDDDEDAAKIAKRLAAEQLNYLLGTMVLVREIGGAISGFQGYQGPAGTRFFAELGKFIKQAQQGDVDMALVKAAANTVGVAAHLPSGQVIKSVDGTVAVMDGKAGPQAVLVGPPLKN